jgi:hypothetical protein
MRNCSVSFTIRKHSERAIEGPRRMEDATSKATSNTIARGSPRSGLSSLHVQPESSCFVRFAARKRACSGNMLVTSGRSRRGHRRYGCSHHFYRGACSNGAQKRKDLLGGKLLNGLQEAVMEPEVLHCVLEAFTRPSKKEAGMPRAKPNRRKRGHERLKKSWIDLWRLLQTLGIQLHCSMRSVRGRGD